MQADECELEMNEEVAEKWKFEGLEDMLAQLTAGTNRERNRAGRPTIEDVRLLKARLEALACRLGLNFNFS